MDCYYYIQIHYSSLIKRLRLFLIVLATDIDSPTCGEHGRLVTPMHAGAKAMDY